MTYSFREEEGTVIFVAQIVFTLFSLVLGILLLLWVRKSRREPQKSNLWSGSIRNFLFNVGLTLTFVIPILVVFFVLIKGDGSWLSVVFDNIPSYVCFIGIILVVIAFIQLLVATIQGVTKEKQQRIAIVRTLVFASYPFWFGIVFLFTKKMFLNGSNVYNFSVFLFLSIIVINFLAIGTIFILGKIHKMWDSHFEGQ